MKVTTYKTDSTGLSRTNNDGYIGPGTSNIGRGSSNREGWEGFSEVDGL